MKIILIYLLIVNAAGFLVMTVDKYFARNNMWRIPEKTLFLLALTGGSIGVLLSMHIVRHKTKHMTFLLGIPLILAAQVGFVLYFLLR